MLRVDIAKQLGGFAIRATFESEGRVTGIDELTTDRSDASGTGYFDAATDAYRTDLVDLALHGRQPVLPPVLGATDATKDAGGRMFGAGLGDNAAAALGLAVEPGDVVVSVGTSGAVSAVSPQPVRDGAGLRLPPALGPCVDMNSLVRTMGDR